VSKEKKRWSEQSPATRGAIISIGLLDAGLRAWALADLVKRPPKHVKGTKTAWAIALAFVNSAGVVPTIYLAWARKAA